MAMITPLLTTCPPPPSLLDLAHPRTIDDRRTLEQVEPSGFVSTQDSSSSSSPNTFISPPPVTRSPGNPHATLEIYAGIHSSFIPPPPATAPRPIYTPIVPNTSLPEDSHYPHRFSTISHDEKPNAAIVPQTTSSLAAMTLEHELEEEEADEIKIRRLALIQAKLDLERAKLENRMRTGKDVNFSTAP